MFFVFFFLSLQEKAAVKLNIKNIHKKIQQCSLKLTLPKPIVYPYTMQSVAPVPEPQVNVKAEHVNGRDTVLRFKLGYVIHPMYKSNIMKIPSTFSCRKTDFLKFTLLFTKFKEVTCRCNILLYKYLSILQL